MLSGKKTEMCSLGLAILLSVVPLVRWGDSGSQSAVSGGGNGRKEEQRITINLE